MAIIITNGSYYIAQNECGGIRKTTEKLEARDFGSLQVAVEQCWYYSGKTKGYYVYDTVTKKICYRMIPRRNLKRKNFSSGVRELLYKKANGCCELCGRKMLLENMTVDHVIPLAQGGSNDICNLAAVCKPCNLFKGSILPADFMERITEIFLYQMEKKYRGKLWWKVTHSILCRMI